MWNSLQTEIGDRMIAVKRFFQAIAGPPGSATLPPLSPAVVTTAKGLVFVQLYAIYEYTVIGIVRAALVEMKGRSTPINTIRFELLSLALDAEIKAATTCGVKSLYVNLPSLFLRTDSSDPLDVPDNTFPVDGTHFRHTQLVTIWNLFGLAQPVFPHGRSRGHVDELVDNRNAIAHGRKTPEEVGRSYSILDIHDWISEIETACLHLVQALKAHCVHPPNLSR